MYSMKDNVTSVCILIKCFLKIWFITVVGAWQHPAAPRVSMTRRPPPTTTAQSASSFSIPHEIVCFTLITHLIKQQQHYRWKGFSVQIWSQTALIQSLHSITCVRNSSLSARNTDTLNSGLVGNYSQPGSLMGASQLGITADILPRCAGQRLTEDLTPSFEKNKTGELLMQISCTCTMSWILLNTILNLTERALCS